MRLHGHLCRLWAVVMSLTALGAAETFPPESVKPYHCPLAAAAQGARDTKRCSGGVWGLIQPRSRDDSSGVRLLLVNDMVFPGFHVPHLSTGENHRAHLTRLGRVCIYTKSEISVSTPRAPSGGPREQREWFWTGSVDLKVWPSASATDLPRDLGLQSRGFLRGGMGQSECEK